MTPRLLPLLPGLLGIGICHAELHFQIAPERHPRPDHLTLDDAMEKLAELRQSGRTEAATLSFRSGLYSLEAVIGPELAGEGLSFESADPESEFPCISSGSLIRNWTLEDGIWTTILADEPSGLFAGAKRCPRARTPNEGYWRIGKSGPDRRTSFTWQEDTIPPVQDLAHLELVFLHDWSISRIPVASLDPATRTLTTKFPIGPQAAHYKIDHYEPHPRFFLEGSRDFLDAPGEWHYDRASKTLRYMPRPGEDPETLRIMAAGRSPALVLRGTESKPLRNVRFSAISSKTTIFTTSCSPSRMAAGSTPSGGNPELCCGATISTMSGSMPAAPSPMAYSWTKGAPIFWSRGTTSTTSPAHQSGSTGPERISCATTSCEQTRESRRFASTGPRRRTSRWNGRGSAGGGDLECAGRVRDLRSNRRLV